jgi:transposase InsO family protein
VPSPRRGRERLPRLAAPRARAGPGRRASDDDGLARRIGAIFAASRRTYRSPRVRAELRARGVRVSRKRVERLMREGGLGVTTRRRVPRTTDSRHGRPAAPDPLGRRFAADRPDAVRLADISYVPTGEGWLYLAAIEDMAAREIVGWSMWPIISGPTSPATRCSWRSAAAGRGVGRSTPPTAACGTPASLVERSWPATARAAR